jgi:hypothetical protein
VDAAPGTPDAAPGTPDAAAGTPDAATGSPDAATGTPDASAGTPDAAPGTPDATVGCDPIAQTGCSGSDKCTQVIESTNPFMASTRCVTNGDVAQGGSCSFGPTGATGFDNCQAGLYCINGTCQDICSTNPDSCSTGSACTIFVDVFEDQGDTTGACQPTCDPVAQDCADAGDGCYIDPVGGEATCTAPTSGGASLGQDDPCDGSGGNCFLNGCGIGFQALIDDDPGAPTTSVCTFFCSPSATDAAGDPTGTTCLDGPGAGYDCRFLQSFYSNTDAVPATVGFCVDTSLWGSCANDNTLPGCAPL